MEYNVWRIWVIRNLYEQNAQRGVIKCSHDRVENIRVALAAIKMVAESPALVKILGVTGTIKSARNKYLGTTTLEPFNK